MKLYKLNINGNSYEVTINALNSDSVRAEVNGVEHVVQIEAIQNIIAPGLMPAAGEFSAPRPPTPVAVSAPKPAVAGVAGAVCAPIPGQIKTVFVKEGDKVESGQKLLMMEAMKMENVVSSDRSGVIQKVLVAAGDSVGQDQPMIQIA